MSMRCAPCVLICRCYRPKGTESFLLAECMESKRISANDMLAIKKKYMMITIFFKLTIGTVNFKVYMKSFIYYKINRPADGWYPPPELLLIYQKRIIKLMSLKIYLIYF